MKRKLKTNCSIVRMFGMFDCGRLMRSIIAIALCAVGLTASASQKEEGFYKDFWSSHPEPQAIKDPANVIDWGAASMSFESREAKHGKFLEASADEMIAAYTARLEKDPTDCEALICRAFAYLKKVGENEAFDRLAQEFGYTFDNDTMHFTGELIQKKGETPEMNDVTAEVCDILLPLMKKAYADLSAVPDRWKGDVAITPDVYPVDEAVYFDWADVLCAKMGLAEMMCVLNMVKGFDVTMDSDRLAYTFNSRSPKNGKRGVQPILENNPDFFSKVRDQKAATEAGDWWASAATLLDQWDKAHAKRPYMNPDAHNRYREKPHFFDWDFEKMDDNTVQCYDWLHDHRDGLINLPYWASPFDYTLMNGDTAQFWTLQPLFGGKFLREHIPEFGVGVKEPWCNEPLLDTLPDPTLCGIYPGVSRTYIGNLMTNVRRAGDFTTIPPYTDDSASSVHAIWYDNMFELGFDNTGNQSIFAWDTASPITLLDPTFNVRGVTAVFTGWSFSGYTNGTSLAKWEGNTIPTPFPKESPMYKRRNVVATANFTIPKVTYLDFDGTSGKLVERTDECEIVKTETTTFEAGKVYAVVRDITIANRITVSGTSANPTKLVLCDGAALMAMNGIEVAAGKALVICGQALGAGMLEATGSDGAAGIGGGGIVTINGGTVMAAGGSSAAGIGGGTVTINSGTLEATGGDGAAGIAGTVKFADGIAYGVAAGADEANALYKTAAAYAADHSAIYVAFPYVSLKIPEAKTGYSYEVSSMGVQPKAALANQTNTYAIAAGATARVRFTPGEDYVWVKAPVDNPMIIANLSGDTVVDAGDLPTTKFVKKGSAGNPWAVGRTTLDSVTAWTNGIGGLVVEGAGNMDDFTAGDPAPWGTGISEVEIDEGVTGIGARAFTGSRLGSVTIPASVTNSIGAAAFAGNASLSNVTVEAMTPPALGADAFAGTAEDLVIRVPSGTGAAYRAAPGWSAYADRIVEPGSPRNPWTVGTPNADDVTAYTNGVGGLVVEGKGDMRDFDPPSDTAPWVTGVSEAEIGEGVTSIGAKAFNDSQLGSVTIPASVTNIGAAAFFGSTSLSNVVVEAMTPPAVGEGAFVEVAEGYRICVPHGTGAAYKAAPDWSLYADSIVEQGTPECPWEIGSPNAADMFAYMDGEGNLVIGGEGAMKDFSDAKPAPWGTSVTSVTLGEGVTGIGAGAFKDCASITNVTTDAVVPPTAADKPVFGSSVLTEVHVPADAGEAYRSATGWSDYAGLIKEVPGCAERPWTLGEGVTAWVDEALTNLAAVVIDNGLTAATNAISLVALTNAFDRGGYEPAKRPLNALLKIDEMDRATYVKPVSWFDANDLEGKTYETLEAALAAGVTAVVPNFETKEAEIPQEIVETEQGEDGKTYLGIVENVATNDVVSPIKVIAAEGLTSMATNEQKNARLVVESKNESDVEPTVVQGLTNKLFKAEDDVDVRSPNFVDLSVFYDKVQTNELESPIAIHIPWKVRGYATYRVARWHDGSSQEIPEGVDSKTGDGEYFEKGEDEVILHLKNFSDYALGESYLLPGSPRNPWPLGEGVTAVTNGTELVIGGEGTISTFAKADGLAELLPGLTAITITSNGVTDVAADMFKAVGTADDPVSLTLPDGWQGELLDENGKWYGANAELTRIPLAVKKVKFAQRYPWNRLVDVGFTLTGPAGETNVVVTVKDGAGEVTNFTETATIPAGGTLETSLVWDAATAGLAADFKSDAVTVEVKIAASDIAAKSKAGTVDLRTAVTLAAGETTVSNVTWSATLWGEFDEEFVTAIGWTNLTTGAKGVFSNLAGVVGEAAEDADLPQKDGEYVLTHSTGDLKSFATFTVSGTGNPAGSKSNPWLVGATAEDGVVAYTNGVGGVVVVGEGDMRDFDPSGDPAPWGTDVTEVEIGGNVTGIGANAFKDSTSLTNVTVLANTPPTMGADAFAGCDIQTINVPKGTGEDYKAAPGWSDFADKIIEQGTPENPWKVGDGVTAYIDESGTLHVDGEGAMTDFSDDYPAPWVAVVPPVTSAEIGEDVTGIGTNAFKDCASLTNVTVLATVPPSLGGGAFSGCDGLKKIYVPRNTGDDYRAASGWSEYAEKILEMPGSAENPWAVGPEDDPNGTVAWTDGNGNVYFKPPRGTVSRTGLETITNAMGGASFPAWLVSADSTVTNGLVMVVGASGAKYDSLEEALKAGEDACTLYDVDGCVVNYDGNGAAGEMPSETFLPGIPTNLAANAFTAAGYAFEGWTTNGAGGRIVFADRARIANPQAGEVYDLKAVWTPVPTTVGSYDDLKKVLDQAAKIGKPVEIVLDGTITPPAGEALVLPTTVDVKFSGDGKIGGLVFKAGSDWFTDSIAEHCDAFAYVDPALTNVAGLVICNGLPEENRPIDLVALTNAMEKAGYQPAVTPLNALVKTGDGVAAMPAKWVDEKGNTYETLQEAIDAPGAKTVTPDFGSEEDPVPPKVIAGDAVGEDLRVYTWIVENETPDVVIEEPLAVIGAIDGLAAFATEVSADVKFLIAPKPVDKTPGSNCDKMIQAITEGNYEPAHVSVATFTPFKDGATVTTPGSQLFAIPLKVKTAGRTNFRVARIHNGVAEAFTEILDEADRRDGTFIVGDGVITAFSSKFSFYAVTSSDATQVALPKETKATYVVTNLTTGAEILPSGTTADGRPVYDLPIGLAVSITATRTPGYVIGGENPLVIDPVTDDAAVMQALIDAELPKAEEDDFLVYDFTASLKTTKAKASKAKSVTYTVNLGMLWWQDVDTNRFPEFEGLGENDQKTAKNALNKLDADEKLALVEGLLNDAIENRADAKKVVKCGTPYVNAKGKVEWCTSFKCKKTPDATCYRVAGSVKLKDTVYVYTGSGDWSFADKMRWIDVSVLNRFGSDRPEKATKVEMFGAYEQDGLPFRMAGQGTWSDKLGKNAEGLVGGLKTLSGSIVGEITGASCPPDCARCGETGMASVFFDCAGLPVDFTDPAQNTTAAFGTFSLKFNKKAPGLK